MRRHLSEILVTILAGLVAGVFNPGEARDCKGCQEFSWMDEDSVYYYQHKFHPQSEIMRWCDDEVGGEHMDCHPDWVEGYSCSSHPDCGGGGRSLVAVAEEVDHLLTLVRNPAKGADPGFAAATLEKRILKIPALSFLPERGVLQLTSCEGQVMAEWRSPKGSWMLLGVD